MAKRDPSHVVAASRLLMDAPRKDAPTSLPPTRELSPTELLQQPNHTLSKILATLDIFVDEMHTRASERTITSKDVKSLVELVKAHATLRQTQLAEDTFARQSQSLATDADIAALLIEAVKAGGPQARLVLTEALATLEETETPALQETPGNEPQS